MAVNLIEGLGAQGLQSLPAAPESAKTSLPFQSVFEDAAAQVNQTQQAVSGELAKLSTGQTDDVHNLMIASAKATASVQLLVQMRDKALEAYNELMRTSL